jgi:hypothetical protein
LDAKFAGNFRAVEISDDAAHKGMRFLRLL